MSSSNAKYSLKQLARRRALIEQMQFLGQMASTETALFHQRAAESFGLSITDMKTVSTLMQEGPMTAGQLANRLSLTSGAVTSVIDRLEAVNLVARHADPKDRRKVIVKVNPQALGEGTKVYDSMGKAFEQVLAAYSTKELEFLAKFYKTSIELTKNEIVKVAKNAKSNRNFHR